MQQRAVILFVYKRSTSNALVLLSLTPWRGCFLVSHVTLAPRMVISLSLAASEARLYEVVIFN